jgi:hypothetical protein
VRREREAANAQPEQVGALVPHRPAGRQRLPAQTLGRDRRQIVADEPDAPDALRPCRAGAGDQHEADLGVERLAQFGRDDGSEVVLRAGGVDQRDDLAVARGGEEAPQQPVAVVRRKRR